MAKAKKKSPAKKAKSAPKAKSKAKVKSKPAAKPAPKAARTKTDPALSPAIAFQPPKPAKSGPVGISPVRSRVIIRRDQEADRTAGGLYIPDAAKDKPLMGKVVAVGTGSFNKKGVKKPLDVKVGDHVVFNRYTGSQILIDGEDLLVIEEKEIIGIVQD